MKTLDRQKLDVVNKTRSNIFGWRGQFTPEFVCTPAFNSVEFDWIRIQASAHLEFNSIEFDGIRNQLD